MNLRRAIIGTRLRRVIISMRLRRVVIGMRLRRVIIGLLAVLILALAPVPAAALPATGLAGLWTLDAHLIDLSGNGNHGTWHGGVSPTYDTAIKAPGGGNHSSVVLDGIDDHVMIPHSATVNVTGSGITLSAWIRLRALPAGDAVTYVVNKTGAYSLQVTSAGRVQAYLGPLTAVVQTAAGAIAANTWHHLVATYDGSHARIYIDKVQRAALALTGGQAASVSPLLLGRRDPLPATVGQGHMDGHLDEVRIYSRALTAGEVEGTGPTPPGPPVPPGPGPGTPTSGSLRFRAPIFGATHTVRNGEATPVKFTLGVRGKAVDASRVSLCLYGPTGVKLATYAVGKGRDGMRYAPGNGQFHVTVHWRQLRLPNGTYTLKVHYGPEATVLGQLTVVLARGSNGGGDR
jgi:hypothetical protein